MNLAASTHSATETWHRVDVSSSSALARTRVSLIGALNTSAIATIDDAVQLAKRSGHALTFELGEMSSISPAALTSLLSGN